MRLSIKYLLSCLALLFLLPACKTTEEVEEATLALSAETLTFAKESGEQTVTVSTNKDSWMAFSPQEASWINLRQEGNTLHIQAEANEHGRERLGTVIVSAGGAQRRIAVRQSAADIVLASEQDRLVFPVEGGAKKVAFESNSTVKVELGAETSWLQLSDVTKSSFVLTAQPNESDASRSIKVLITAGTKIKEIEVSQDGTSQYILPLMQFPSSLRDVIRFEHGRLSELTRSFNRGSAIVFRYATQSTLFPLIEYEFEHERSKSYQATIQLCLDDKAVKDNPSFTAFLQAAGYQKSDALTTAEQDVYVNSRLPFNLNIAFDPSGEALLETIYLPRQTQAYRTFDHLPLRQQAAICCNRPENIHGYKKADVAKKEVEWKGELDATDPGADRDEYQLYTAKSSLDGEAYRGYFYLQPSEHLPATSPFIGEVNTVQAIFDDVTLGFWTDALGNSYMTKEMNQLLNANGYRYLRELKGGFIAYYNGTTKSAYLLRVLEIKGKRALELQTFFVELGGGGGNTRGAHTAKNENLLERRARISSLIERHLQQSRPLQLHRR